MSLTTSGVNPDIRFEKLHQQWLALSGMKLPPWNQHGVKHRWAWLVVECGELGMPMEEALPLVIARIKREARKFQGYYLHLSFYKITDAARFTEHLSMAMAEKRVRERPQQPPGLREVNKATGRPTEVATPPAKRIDEILASEAFKEFVKLKEKL